MKKAAILLVGLFFSTGALAQEKAKQPSPPSTAVHSAEYRMGGIITAIDPAAGTISIRQQKVKGERTITLKLGEEGMKKVSASSLGDNVNVWVKGDTLTKIEKIPDAFWRGDGK